MLPELQEIQADRQAVIEACRQDLNILAQVAAPDTASLEFPPLFLQTGKMVTASALQERNFDKYAIGFPRGFAKTTFLKILILSLILFTQRKFILVVCATANLANNVIADIQDMLDHENVQNLWGNWRFGGVEIDRQDMKKFIFLGRNIILKGVGQGTSVRGIAVKMLRPDVIVCDDAQTKESAQNETSAKEFITWFFGTLMKAKSPFSCTYMYVGNMYPNLILREPRPGRAGLYGCMLRNLKESPSWISFIVGGILADGRSLWEELQPTEQLYDELAQDKEFGQEEVFFSEVLNDPDAISSAYLNFNILQPYEVDLDLCTGKFIVVDPSGWNKVTLSTSDDVAIGVVEVYGEVPVLIESMSDIMTPLETIHNSIKLAFEYGIATIVVESVAYQSTLLFWFEHVCQQNAITGLEFLPIDTHGIAKNRRIVQFFKAWQEGEAGVHQKSFSKVLSQARNFNVHTTKNKDDLLDVCAYMTKVVSRYRREIMLDLPGVVTQRTVHDQEGGRDLHNYNADTDSTQTCIPLR